MKAKARMAGPGLVVDRTAKHGKINIAIDPSPEGFLSEARRENGRVKILLMPGDGATEPIEISAMPKSLMLKCEAAMIPPHRLADLETLITEQTDVHVVLEYTPHQEALPFMIENEKDANHARGKIDVGPGLRAESTSQTIPLKFKGLRGCSCQITVMHDAKGWRAGYEIKVGNLEKTMSPADQIPRGSRAEAIDMAKSSIQQWAEEIEPGGNADARRSMARRLTQVCEQIDEQQVGPWIDQAELEADGRQAEECEEETEECDEP